jgi:hypothetical protein
MSLVSQQPSHFDMWQPIGAAVLAQKVKLLVVFELIQYQQA